MDTLDRLADYYVEAFWGDLGVGARKYMLDRGFTEETLRAFRVGFAPASWGAPMDLEDMKRLKRLGHLHGDTGNDFFARRILFPICDARGIVKGFCGRTVGDPGKSAKYKVSPETTFFRKGDYLFGLDLARKGIFRENKVILCEGFTDVMAYRQVGVPVSVSIMGVKLTDEQTTLIAQYTSNVFTSLDPDAGGNPATTKILGKLGEKGFGVAKINLPAGKDPAEHLLGR